MSGVVEPSELQRAMANIRRRRTFRLQGLHDQTERLTDWREHVKSAPLLAVGLGAIAGFAIVKAILPKPAPPAPPAAAVPRERRSKSNQLLQKAIAVAAPIAYTAIRNYTLGQLSGILGDRHREHFASTDKSARS